ncbi:MAG: SDR family NAD(P)-dependent oxidoreductase [Lactobacillus sp.]|jgi:nucleoside-diphosphate-sugar epimerase|nr:SDR family NAD(P)-dependent oxidoreductase [Lactobacillus sp.]
MTKNVLVTGGTGFLGLQIILQLLQQGYQVRTTLRSLDKQEQVRATLTANGVQNLDKLSFVVADLTKDADWPAAMQDMDYVLSVAAPVFAYAHSNEANLMQPAIDGTLRILKAAQSAGVKRVVMTANFGGVGFSNHDKNTVTTEKDWTDPAEPGLSLYEKSKLLAEQAAWQFVQDPKNHLELITINPVAILGPALSAHVSGSFGLINNLLNGSMKRLPNIPLNIVDVRDVAALHIRAMTNPKAAGQRFIASADGQITMPQMAALIRSKYPELAPKIPTKTMPDWLINIGALFNQRAKEGRLMLNMNRHVSNAKAKEILNWQPVGSIETTILATLASMAKFGLV